MKKFLLVVGLGLLASVPVLRAQASHYISPSAGSLKATCSGGTQDAMCCVGYMSGWADAYVGSAYPTGSEGERIVFRFQDGVTLAQIRRMFIKYVTDHPEVENQSATKVLVTATRPVVEYLLLDKNAKAKPGTVWKSNALKMDP